MEHSLVRLQPKKKLERIYFFLSAFFLWHFSLQKKKTRPLCTFGAFSSSIDFFFYGKLLHYFVFQQFYTTYVTVHSSIHFLLKELFHDSKESRCNIKVGSLKIGRFRQQQKHFSWRKFGLMNCQDCRLQTMHSGTFFAIWLLVR